MIKWVKQFFFGRPETEAERQSRRKAKMYMLGAGAGSAMQADQDGIVRIEDGHGNDEVRDDADTGRSGGSND